MRWLLAIFLWAVPTMAQITLSTVPGWVQIPNSTLKPNSTPCSGGSATCSPCPPDNFWSPVNVPQFPTGYIQACPVIYENWSSAWYDPIRHRMIIWGGGHNDYEGNELYILDLTCVGKSSCAGNNNGTNARPLYRLTNPSPPNNLSATTVDVLNTAAMNGDSLVADNRPNSRHTYDGLVYAPNVDKFYSLGGSLNSSGFFGQLIWSLDPASISNSCSPNCSSTWAQVTSTTDIAAGSDATDYDPKTGLIWVANTSFIGSFDPKTGTYSRKNIVGMGAHATGVVDPDHELFLYIGADGGSNGIVYFDVTGGDSYAQHNSPTMGSGCPAGGFGSVAQPNYPGAFWDPIGHRVVFYPQTGNTLYYIYPQKVGGGTWQCTSETYGSVQGTDYPQPTAPNISYASTMRHFVYASDVDAVILCNDPAANCWYLHMNRGNERIVH